MASLARVLLVVGLLVAVVFAAPQQQPIHPLRDTYRPSTERESSATEHGSSKFHGTDDSNENIHNVNEDTESGSEEVHSIRNEDNTDRETATTQRYNHNPFFSSFALGSQHTPSVSVHEEVHGTQNEDSTDRDTITTTVETQHFDYNPYNSFGSGNHQTNSETPSFNLDDVNSHSSTNNTNFGQDNIRTSDAYGPTFGRHPSRSQF